MSTIDENLKRFYDFIASICGMIVFSPLFLIIMILIKCDSKGKHSIKYDCQFA